MKTLKQHIEENLNIHFQITKEEQEEAKGQWDDTIAAVIKGFIIKGSEVTNDEMFLV